MSKSDTLVMGVIYPGVEKYLVDYCASIEAQTYKNFDLLILIHQLDRDQYKKKSENTILINVRDSATPATIRFQAITYGIQNDYEHLIFTDTDDYFSENRIEMSRKMLGKYDFVYNDMDTKDLNNNNLQSNILSKLGIKLEYRDPGDIIRNNFFGLSNTAVSLRKLKEFYIPKNIIAVDWWIFTILLLNGNIGGFLKESKTYYRQSEMNLVGINKPLDDERLKLGIEVKRVHYKGLLSFCQQQKIKRFTSIYEKELEGIIELSTAISNVNFRRKYIEVVNRNINSIFTGWWSEIVTLNQWRNYA